MYVNENKKFKITLFSFFFIGSLFRRGMPLLKTAFRKGSSLAKKAASSDLAKSIGNTVGATATDIAATAASDLIAGRDLGDLKSKSTAKLTKARKQIADLIKPVDEKKKEKRKQSDELNKIVIPKETLILTTTTTKTTTTKSCLLHHLLNVQKRKRLQRPKQRGEKNKYIVFLTFDQTIPLFFFFFVYFFFLLLFDKKCLQKYGPKNLPFVI